MKDEDGEKELTESNNDLLRLTTPDFWNTNIEGNAEVRTEREYDLLLLAVGEHTKEDLDKITIKKFYSLLEYIKQKQKK